MCRYGEALGEDRQEQGLEVRRQEDVVFWISVKPRGSGETSPTMPFPRQRGSGDAGSILGRLGRGREEMFA